MKHKKFNVYLMNKPTTVSLKTITPQGSIHKSFNSKEEAVKYAKNNKKPHNRIIIKCPNEDDIIYE